MDGKAPLTKSEKGSSLGGMRKPTRSGSVDVGSGAHMSRKHERTGRMVAIKALLKERVATDPELQQRETGVLKTLQHPNIVALLDVFLVSVRSTFFPIRICTQQLC